MEKLVYEALELLNSKKDIRGFGELLHNYWEYKKSMHDDISKNVIDDYYIKARKAGAIGGKLIGAGGGGFILLCSDDKRMLLKL